MEIEEDIISTLELALPPFPSPAMAPPTGCPTPQTDPVQLLCFLLSCLQPGVATSQAKCILQETLETLDSTVQKAFSNLEDHLKLEVAMDTPPTPPSDSSSAVWDSLAHMCHTPSPLKSLFALRHLSSTLSLLLSTHLQVCLVFCLDDSSFLLDTFQQVWANHVTKLTKLLPRLEMDPDAHWSRCLATVAVCLVAADVSREASFGVSGREGLRVGLHRDEISQLLDHLDNVFPSSLYHKYREWESQEVGGASKLVQTAAGGLLLKVYRSYTMNKGHNRNDHAHYAFCCRVCTSSWKLSPP